MVAENVQERVQVEENSNWPRARIVQWVVAGLIIAIAEIVFFAGYVGASYLIDAVAVAAFFALRKAREQTG